MKIRPEPFELEFEEVSLEEAKVKLGQLKDLRESPAYRYMLKMANAIAYTAYTEILGIANFATIQFAKGQIVGLEAYARALDDQIDSFQKVVKEESSKIIDMEGIDEEEIGS